MIRPIFNSSILNSNLFLTQPDATHLPHLCTRKYTRYYLKSLNYSSAWNYKLIQIFVTNLKILMQRKPKLFQHPSNDVMKLQINPKFCHQFKNSHAKRIQTLPTPIQWCYKKQIKRKQNKWRLRANDMQIKGIYHYIHWDKNTMY